MDRKGAMHQQLVGLATTTGLLIAGMVLITSTIAPALGALCWMASLASLAVVLRSVNDEREADELEVLNAEYADLPKELW